MRNASEKDKLIGDYIESQLRKSNVSLFGINYYLALEKFEQEAEREWQKQCTIDYNKALIKELLK